jgi:glycosyltransferase involved in cell wall biosynthesis
MKKAKVLLITRYFPPINCIATLRMYSWAKYFQKWGWEVDVLTTSKHNQITVSLDLDTSFASVHETPYFDPIALFSLEKQVKSKKEGLNKGGVKGAFKRFLVRIYRERLNERMPGRTDFWLFPALKELKKRKAQGIEYDYIISSYGPPVCHLLGAYAKRIFKGKWLADYRDLWVENHIYKGLWPFTLLEKILEKRSVKGADLLSTVSFALTKKLEEKFPGKEVLVIENGFDKEIMKGANSDYFKDEPEKFRVVYTGSIYRNKRDPSPLFEAVKELEAEKKIDPSTLELRFYGASMGDLDELIEKHQVQDYAKHWGLVNQIEAFSLQESASALLFLEAPNPEIDGNLTGKLFEYLYATPPIIGVGINKNMEAGKLINKANGGFICGQEVKAIKECLIELMHKPKPFLKRKEVIAAYSRESQALKVMQSLSGEAQEALQTC